MWRRPVHERNLDLWRACLTPTGANHEDTNWLINGEYYVYTLS